MSARIKLADVAAAAGVSRTTASLVLSGRAEEMRISEAKAAEVRRVADELGYRRNAVSVGLRTGSTRTLGLVSDVIATAQMGGEMVKGAIEAARDAGYLLFIAETEGDATTEAALVEAMMDRLVDGVIFTSMFTRLREVPKALERVPTVLLNTVTASPTKAPSVIPDEYQAGRDAARLLLDAGHRKINLIGVGVNPDQVATAAIAGMERLAGIRDELATEGLDVTSGFYCDSWHPPQGFEATRALLAADPDPGAVICFNDRIAMGAYQAIYEADLRIPADVSVLSFDNHDMAEWLHPGVSSFAIPHEALGRRAVELLLEQLGPGAKKPTSGHVHRLHMPLAVRGSIQAV